MLSVSSVYNINPQSVFSSWMLSNLSQLKHLWLLQYVLFSAWLYFGILLHPLQSRMVPNIQDGDGQNAYLEALKLKFTTNGFHNILFITPHPTFDTIGPFPLVSLC